MQTPAPVLAKASTSGGALVTKAVLRAASLLGINNKQLASIIGVSEPTVSRMGSGTYTLTPGEKPFELSVLAVRLYRSLDAIVGGDDDVAKQWMRNENTALGSVPIETIQKVTGLVNVIAYLDARRAII